MSIDMIQTAVHCLCPYIAFPIGANICHIFKLIPFQSSYFAVIGKAFTDIIAVCSAYTTARTGPD